MKSNILILCLCLGSLGVLAQQPSGFSQKKRALSIQKKLGEVKFSGIPYANREHQEPLISNVVYPTLPALNFSTTSSKKLHPVSYSVFGTPNFIDLHDYANKHDLSTERAVEQASFEVLDMLGSTTGLKNAREHFKIQTVKRDVELNMVHVRLQQVVKGITVYGADAWLHFKNGIPQTFNGTYYPAIQNVSLDAQLDQKKAISLVEKDVAMYARFKKEGVAVPSWADLSPKAELVIYHEAIASKFVPRLAWHLTIKPNLMQRFEYFVDAHSKVILNHYNHTCSLVPEKGNKALVDGPKQAQGTDVNGKNHTINTYQVGSNYFLVDASKPMFKASRSVLPNEPVGVIWTIDANYTYGDKLSANQISTTNNTWTDAKSVSSHFNAEQAYSYYKNVYQRESIDGNGGNIISLVNVNDPDTGKGMDNAYWDGTAMYYGNGDKALKPLAGGLDVAGHEMTHGVIQSTANLNYQGEPGAINESFADVFASMIDRDDWLIGEDVVRTNYFPSGALRSMSDPHNGGTSLNDEGYQPRHMNEKYTGSADNGGVHINSGIPNWAFYKFASAIGKDRAEKVYYQALDKYLTRSSHFSDLRIAVVQSATDLYGGNSNEVKQAGLAFDAVGVGTQGGDYKPTDISLNPGKEYYLVYGPSEKKLALSAIPSTAFSTLSLTGLKNRPSVTDDGKEAYFVSLDKRLRGLNINPQVPNEQIIENSPSWENVAISKDGDKIALITTQDDTSIYVYSFAAQEMKRFKLYNPTFSNAQSGGPVYADALEWDYSGEYLVYDCNNVIRNNSGTDIEFWDVNFIRVWNNRSKTFGDGKINKLISSLPDGVSIGNPTFSKNSPYILAFDYVNEKTNEYKIIGVNIEANQLKEITSNSSLAFPSYSKLDDALYYTSSNSSTSNIYKIPLDASKIGASGEKVPLVYNAKWPVIFSVGERKLPTSVEDVTKQIPMQLFPNPFTNNLTIRFDDAQSDVFVEVYNAYGERVKEFSKQGNGIRQFDVDLSNLSNANYLVRVRSSKGTNSNVLTKN